MCIGSKSLSKVSIIENIITYVSTKPMALHHNKNDVSSNQRDDANEIQISNDSTLELKYHCIWQLFLKKRK